MTLDRICPANSDKLMKDTQPQSFAIGQIDRMNSWTRWKRPFSMP